ncbi:MAG: hypothetical protein M3410_17425 [Acidobacteriota bacterium]|nr:hypothetical protein [Acidobacteriota bacterium]
MIGISKLQLLLYEAQLQRLDIQALALPLTASKLREYVGSDLISGPGLHRLFALIKKYEAGALIFPGAAFKLVVNG